MKRAITARSKNASPIPNTVSCIPILSDSTLCLHGLINYLDRHQPMFPWGVLFDLGPQHLEGANHPWARLSRFDHLVDLPHICGGVRIKEFGAIFLEELTMERCRVL